MAEPKPTLQPENETELSQDQSTGQGPDVSEDADPYLALEAELETLRNERDEMRDRMMRALAEAENSRKRAEKDRRDAQLYGGSKIARDILPVYDNLSRALHAVTEETRGAAGGLVEGVELTLRELTNVMQKHGVERISPEVGDMFDPHAHQAMFEAPVPDFKAGQIIQVMADGFKLYE